MQPTLSVILGTALLATGAIAGDAAVTIEGPVDDVARGVQVFKVTSPCLGRTSTVEVLVPDHLEPGRTYRTLYVLPVGGESKTPPPWGNGLAEMRKLDAANKYGLICVGLEFDSVPWYGSHATDPKIRHDQYLMETVVPLIEKQYPASGKPADRLLIGFSKSGWGAVSLLLRHPEFFGVACSWDAPLMMDEKNLRWGSAKHFGTPDHAAAYAPANLAPQQAARFVDGPVRLTILGHDIFGPDTKKFHALLEKNHVPHHFDNDLRYKHGWETGWVAKALAIMLGTTGETGE